MLADEETRAEIVALVESTYAAMSTPGSPVDQIFDSPDIAIAGSGMGELFTGPEIAVGAASAVSSWGFTWTAETVTVWRRGEIAWAQILGSVHTRRESGDEDVPYWTTGVFGLEDGAWRWLYWGGAEPRDPPRV